METWNIVKNRHHSMDSFHTSKPGNFNSLRVNFYYDSVTLKTDWRGDSVPK